MRILSLPPRAITTSARLFSASARIHANRAIIYSQNGQPADVLRALTIPNLTTPPSPQTVNLRIILSPINPADVNVIEGVYPSRPRPSSFPGVQGEELFVGGNEGLGEVTGVGESVKNLKRGDWVVMKAPQVGTWRSAVNVREGQVLKVPRLEGLSEVNAATMMVRLSRLRIESNRRLFYRLTPRPHTAFCRTSSLWREGSGSYRMVQIAQCVKLDPLGVN